MHVNQCQIIAMSALLQVRQLDLEFTTVPFRRGRQTSQL